MLNRRCRRAVKENVNMAVPWYLMAGYAYEVLNTPILSDGCWDWLCDVLYERHAEIMHIHKHLVSLDDLQTGTASGFVAYLPEMVKNSCHSLIESGEET